METKVIVAIIALLISQSGRIPKLNKLTARFYNKYIISRKKPLNDLNKIIIDKTFLKSAQRNPTKESITKDKTKVTEILTATANEGKKVKKTISWITNGILFVSLSLILIPLLVKLNLAVFKIEILNTVLNFILNMSKALFAIGNGDAGVIVVILLCILFIFYRVYGLHIMASENYKKMNNIVLSRIQERTMRAMEIARTEQTVTSSSMTIDCHEHCENFNKKINTIN